MFEIIHSWTFPELNEVQVWVDRWLSKIIDYRFF